RVTVHPPTSSYTLSLHDALPIFIIKTDLRCRNKETIRQTGTKNLMHARNWIANGHRIPGIAVIARTRGHEIGLLTFSLRSPKLRSEEHTSELQSRENLVCRLLLE